MNKIEANHVDFYYGDFHALKNISLSIAGNQHSYGFSIE